MIIDGNKIAEALKEKLVTELLFSSPKKVCFVIFGGNAATEQFVKTKSRIAESVGIDVDVKRYADFTDTREAVAMVHELNKAGFDGIVVQLPLSKGMDMKSVLDAVSPEKDIDVLGSIAKESYVSGKINRTPPVAQAVREVLEACSIAPHGKSIVVLGRGRLVGEPVHLMLSRENISHDVVTRETDEIIKLKLLKNADIVISGIGAPHIIKPEMIKEGVVLIDAGTSEQAGELVGDIDPACAKKASFMTPVPGGIGPITVICVLRNLL